MKTRDLILGLLLAAAILLSMVWNRLPSEGTPSLLDTVPTEGWQMRSRDLPLTDLEKRWLDGAQGLKRLYALPTGSWMLAVTDGTANRHAVHDPSYCFRGDGWSVVRERTVPLDQGSARLLTLQRGDETLEALYWFYAGGEPFDSMPEYWLRSTLRRLTRGWSGPEPLLFILRPVRPEQPDWDRALAEVAPRFLPDSASRGNKL